VLGRSSSPLALKRPRSDELSATYSATASEVRVTVQSSTALQLATALMLAVLRLRFLKLPSSASPPSVFATAGAG